MVIVVIDAEFYALCITKKYTSCIDMNMNVVVVIDIFLIS